MFEAVFNSFFSTSREEKNSLLGPIGALSAYTTVFNTVPARKKLFQINDLI